MTDDTVKPARHPMVLNIDDAEEATRHHGDHWGASERRLTPGMPCADGHLGVSWVRLEPGRVYCPFHHHLQEDEAYFILSGTGRVRYGEESFEVRAGDCVSLPRGSGAGHQIGNPSQTEDLVYLTIGENRSDEVCVYPDTGKVLIRGIKRLVQAEDVGYMDGEPDPPTILGGE